MAEVSRLTLKFDASGAESTRAQIRGVSNELDTVSTHADRAGSRLGSVFRIGAGILGGAAVFGLFQAAKGLLMIDANAERAHMALETVVGSTARANELFASIQQFAAETPFEFPELVAASINLEAFGLKSEKWLPIIGDTAAAMGKSVDQVTQAVLDASSGQYERLKELGVQARVEGDKLVLSYMENGKMITETVDKNNKEIVADTIAGIWNKKYEGAMKKQSKTFIGQFSTLKDNISMRLQEMSQGVFGFATKSLAFFNDIFALGFLNAVRGTFGRGVSDFIGQISSMAGAFISAFQSGTRVNDLVKRFPAPLQAVAKAALLVADAFGYFLRTLRGDGIMAALAILPDLLSQVLSGLADVAGQVLNIAIDTAVSIGGWLWEHKDDIWGGIKTLIGWTGDVINAVVDVVIDGAISLAGDLLAAAGDLWGWIKGKLLGGTGEGATSGEVATGAVSGISLGMVLVDGLLALSEYLLGIAADFGAWLKPKLLGAWDLTLDIGTATLSALVDLAGDLASLRDDAATWIKTAINWTTDKTVDVGKLILNADVEVRDTSGVDPGRSFVQKVIDGIKSSISAIREAGLWLVTNLFQGFGFAVGALGGVILGAVGLLIFGIVKAIMSPSSIVTGYMAVNNWLRQVFISAFNLFTSTIGTMFTSFWSGVASGFTAVIPVEQFKLAGMALIVGLWNGIVVNLAALVTWLGTLPTLLLDAIPFLGATLSLKGVSLIQGLWDGAFAKWLELSAWLGSRPETAVSAIGDVSETLWQKGVQLIEGLQDGVDEQFENFMNWVGTLGNTDGPIGAFVPSLFNVLYQSGIDLVAGMAAGIDAGAHLVAEAVNRIIGAIPGPIRSILGIGSPSKVMRDMLIGVPQGMALGMMDGLRDVQQASMALAEAARSMSPKMGGQFRPIGGGATEPSAPLGKWRYLTPPTKRTATSSGGPYYDLRGSIIGGDIDRFINDKIASGQGVRIDRSVSRLRLAESY